MAADAAPLCAASDPAAILHGVPVEVVTRLVADGEGPVVAVTSDRELAARVHTVGATVHGASWLWDLLDETSAR